MSGAVILSVSMAAGAPNPTFQPMGFSPAFTRSCQCISCAFMPRAMRRSYQGALIAFQVVIGRMRERTGQPARNQPLSLNFGGEFSRWVEAFQGFPFAFRHRRRRPGGAGIE